MMTIASARVIGNTRSVTGFDPKVADICEPLSATVPTSPTILAGVIHAGCRGRTEDHGTIGNDPGVE
jgi:hypothetical protein